ncbi:hypothetical protein EDWATA_00708 [Edwardsiella tarda ATCC 23685]|uniref:Uncharacterized protein n=1 Tax=Edwardsiella tarda ATCC 23685 TaxID=500638 RepID=D4F1W4_EDWTA|nr:hypothetical protein EDWATA_00708 [Edwardsiella tarda ATCC 23685]
MKTISWRALNENVISSRHHSNNKNKRNISPLIFLFYHFMP